MSTDSYVTTMLSDLRKVTVTPEHYLRTTVNFDKELNVMFGC